MKETNRKIRIEDGEKIIYVVENESYDDDYGSLVMDYVPYRIDSKGDKKRLSPTNYCLSPLEADDYIRFVKYTKCEHCCSTKKEYL